MNPLKDLHILDTCKLFILVISLFPQPVNLLPKFRCFTLFLSVVSFCIGILGT